MALIRCVNCFEIEFKDTSKFCPRCGHPRGAPAEERIYLNPGTVLGERYIVGQVVNSGGFGIIYKGWDGTENRIIAIKEFFQSGLVTRSPYNNDVLLVSESRSEEFEEGRRRFADEAVYTSKFNGHANIIPVLDAFDQNATTYYIMEFIPGGTLDSYMETHELPVEESVGIIIRICNAVSKVHKAGILHRDISPNNILIPDNYPETDVKLIDFGAARFTPNEKPTVQTQIMKPGYSPPEQYVTGEAQIKAQNEQIDVYALGATLYHLTTGIRPEEATNRKKKDVLPTPVALNPKIPAFISDAIQSAMAMDLPLRYKSVEEFQIALSGQIKVMSPKEKRKAIKRKRRIVILSITAAIIVGIMALGFYFTLNAWQVLPTSVYLIYSVSGDEAADNAKLNALEMISEDFKEYYSLPNTDIIIMGVDQVDYPAAVLQYMRSGNYPSVVETTAINPDELGRMLDVSGIIGETEKSECYFLDDYSSIFPNKRQLPVGFNVPAVYINHKLSDFDRFGVQNMTELLASMPFSISENGLSCNESYAKYFAEAFGANYTLSLGRESFTDDITGAYFSDTTEYRTILGEMVGKFSILFLDVDQVPAKFSSLWSVMPGSGAGQDITQRLLRLSGAEQEVAKRLLKFMLSENAQHFMHISNPSNALPINRLSLEAYVDTYGDFREFFAGIERYTFSPPGSQ